MDRIRSSRSVAGLQEKGECPPFSSEGFDGGGEGDEEEAALGGAGAVNAARGMASLLTEDLDAVPTNVERQLALDSLDAETLLVDWLGEMAYWAESESLVFISYELRQVSRTNLKATVIGGRVPTLLKHIKAVTYHELDIVETKKGLMATVVFDV